MKHIITTIALVTNKQAFAQSKIAYPLIKYGDITINIIGGLNIKKNKWGKIREKKMI